MATARLARTRTARIAVATTAATLSLGLLAGCSSDDADSDSMTSTAMTSAPMTTTSAASDDAAPAALVGPGCAAYAEANPTGPASVEALAEVPLATAAGNVPMLSMLTAAVSGGVNPDVNLVDTLDDGEYTVFAPTDEAFAKLPPETVETLKTDSDLLTKVLTYHVVSGQAGTDAIAGEHTTLQGEKVTVTGSGDDWKVNDAGVVCGGISTANAKVYLIDTVLMPPM